MQLGLGHLDTSKEGDFDEKWFQAHEPNATAAIAIQILKKGSMLLVYECMMSTIRNMISL